MKTMRWIVFYLSAVIMLTTLGYADMVTWVDENGVRHYSNVEGSDGAGKTTVVDEYKSPPENKKTYNSKDRFKVLDIYNEQNEKYREKKAQQEHERNQRKAKELADKKAAKRCADAKDGLEKVRSEGWKKYPSSEADSIGCPDSAWVDAGGVVHNNAGPCMARKNRARMEAYKRAIFNHKMAVDNACN